MNIGTIQLRKRGHDKDGRALYCSENNAWLLHVPSNPSTQLLPEQIEIRLSSEIREGEIVTDPVLRYCRECSSPVRDSDDYLRFFGGETHG